MTQKTKIQATNIYTSAVSVVSILHKKFIITKKNIIFTISDTL